MNLLNRRLQIKKKSSIYSIAPKLHVIMMGQPLLFEQIQNFCLALLYSIHIVKFTCASPALIEVMVSLLHFQFHAAEFITSSPNMIYTPQPTTLYRMFLKY